MIRARDLLSNLQHWVHQADSASAFFNDHYSSALIAFVPTAASLLQAMARQGKFANLAAIVELAEGLLVIRAFG